MRRSVLLAALAAAPALLPAQGAAPATTAIRAARMLDVTTGQMVTNPVILVQGSRILSVGSGNAPANARVLDLGDVTLMPGFIDLHTHLVGDISANSRLEPVTLTMSDLTLRAAYNGRKTALAGFTTVRDFGGEATVALSNAVERGIAVSPHIVPSREAIGITGGHCDATGYAPGILEAGAENGIANGPWRVVEAVRYQIKHGAKVIKVCATAGVLSLEGPVGAQQLSDDELKAIVDEASRHGIRVAAHAHGTEGIKAAIRAGVTTIEHGSMLDDETIALLKSHGTYLVPTTYLTERINMGVLPDLIRSKAETIIPLARASLRKAIASGTRIAFGTDAGVYPHGENANEFVSYTKLGMSPLAALQSATTVAAEALGVTDRGTIAAGKLADLVALQGNPLQDITATLRVKWVMVGGRVVAP